MLEAGNGHALHDVGRIGEPDITAITEIKMLLIDTLGRVQQFYPENMHSHLLLSLGVSAAFLTFQMADLPLTCQSHPSR